MAELPESADEAAGPSRMGRLYQALRRATPQGLSRLVPSKLRKTLHGKVVPVGRSDTVTLYGSTVFEYGLSDPYWGMRKISDYEPEMRWAIDRYADKDTLFVDCGANIGLWSCYASGKINNPERVIAIEPGTEVLPQLRRNQAINHNRFTVLPAAVWEKANKTVDFTVSESHALSTISGMTTELPGEMIPENLQARHTISVATTSLDALVSERGEDCKKIIVKLDVAGAEIAALKGAATTLRDRNTLVIYEDHSLGSDSKFTDHLLASGMNVYHLGSDSDVRPIKTAADLTSIKDSHNFFACRPDSEFDKDLMSLSAAKINTREPWSSRIAVEGKSISLP
jgi:FkbM family methyltransferase